jgi:hypothetical protein
MGVPMRAVAQRFPVPPLSDDLRRIVELLTQIAAYGDHQYLNEDLPAVLEDRLAALKRMNKSDEGDGA